MRVLQANNPQIFFQKDQDTLIYNIDPRNENIGLNLMAYQFSTPVINIVRICFITRDQTPIVPARDIAIIDEHSNPIIILIDSLLNLNFFFNLPKTA